MDDEQIEKSFAHLSDDEFAGLVVGFTDDGVPIVENSGDFVKLWNV